MPRHSPVSVDVLAEAGGEPDAPALVTTSRVLTPRVWTYASLSEAVDVRAHELREGGVTPGALAPLVVEPDAEGVLSLLALWRIGAVPLPLHGRSTAAERDAARSLHRPPAGTQVVVWTSGTGGRARGVALSFQSFTASARGAARRLGLGSDDVWLASLSPAHVGGLALITRSLILGGAMVAAGAFDAEVASGLVDGTALAPGAPRPVTHASFVPTQLLRLLDHRRGAPAPPTFRCALIGGAHAPADLVERAHRGGWPLALTYGSTEMCSQVATAPPDLTRRKPGTVGAPLDGVEVRIGEGEEILVRGATQAIGYVSPAGVGGDRVGGGDGGEGGDSVEGGDGPEGGDAVTGAVADTDGWYHSGDLGRLDGEGHLWVTGRRADRIVSGGVTIDAVEVEEALRSHPSVIDACVVGLPDDEWGERVAAWVEPVVGEFDPDEVELHVRTLLSAAKVPRTWHVAGGLPRNANGKTDRGRVRETLEARL
jgi:O-succinylbenzoic acid--CoA ligase